MFRNYSSPITTARTIREFRSIYKYLSNSKIDINSFHLLHFILSDSINEFTLPILPTRPKDGVVLETSEGVNFSSDRDIFSLCLSCVQTSAIGQYTCIAANQFGEAKCEAQLVVQVWLLILNKGIIGLLPKFHVAEVIKTKNYILALNCGYTFDFQ